jgi:hypothetical protein
MESSGGDEIWDWGQAELWRAMESSGGDETSDLRRSVGDEQKCLSIASTVGEAKDGMHVEICLLLLDSA